MYIILVQFLIVHFVVFVSAERIPYTNDYGWRDFIGNIPTDAFIAGSNEKGSSIYIGQVLFENNLIPGTIDHNSDKIHFEWYNVDHSTNQNIKILCSYKSYKLQWLDINSHDLAYLADQILIKGGYQAGYATYIGRTVKDGVASVGKVICTTDTCLGLYTTNNGTIAVYPTFQVLIYNPNIEKAI